MRKVIAEWANKVHVLCIVVPLSLNGNSNDFVASREVAPRSVFQDGLVALAPE